MSDRWRGVLASLLNPDLRVVLAEVIGDRDRLTDSRRARATARLIETGLVRRTPGGLELDEEFVRGLLAEDPRPRPTGPQRFLDGSGRIDRYPVQSRDLVELLRWVAAQAFEVDEIYTEPETNERLEPFTDDVAALRRHLVDAEVLERTRSGSEYALVPSDL